MAESTWRPAAGPRRPADRAAALGILGTFASAAMSGQPRCVLVRGPAGSGTSTLLHTARDALLRPGALVLEAAGRESPSADPYAVIRRLLAPLGGSLPAGTGYSWQAMSAHVHRLLAESAADSLVALLVDDAYLCDEDSIRCLDHVLRRAAGLPLLTLMTDHPAEPGPGRKVLREIGVRSPHDVIDLPPLGPAEVTEVVGRVLGETPGHGFTRGCAEVSGGDPRLLHGILAALRERGLRPDAHGTRALKRIADEVRASLALDGLARHGEHVRRVAQAVALLDTSADTELIGALARVPPPVAVAALDVLRREGLLVPAAAEDSVGRIRPGLAPRLLVTLPDEERRELRIRTARLLNEAGRPAEEVARLLPDSLHASWMRDAVREASAANARLGALPAASALLGRLVATESAESCDRQRTQDRVELAKILALTDPQAALPHLRWVLAHTEEPRIRAHTAIRFGAAAAGTPHVSEAVVLLDEALEHLTPLAVRGTAADAELRAGTAYARLGLAILDPAGTTTVERVANWPEPPGATSAERRLLVLKSLGVALESQPQERALDLVRRGLRVPEPPGAAGRWPIPPELPAAVVYYLADETCEARAMLHGMDREAAGSPHPLARILALSVRSLISHAVGDVTTAAHEAQSALALMADAPEVTGLTLPYIARLQVLVEQDRADLAQQVLEHDDFRRVGQSLYERHLLWTVRGRLKLLQGDPASALRILLRCANGPASGISNPVFSRWRLFACQALMMLGRSRAAARLAEEAGELAVRWNTPRAVGLGLLTSSLGNDADEQRRLESLEEAVEVLAESPGRLDLAWAEYEFGSALLRRGDSGGARIRLWRAAGLAERCGSLRLGGQVRSALAAAGGRARLTDLLTRCEHRVAELAARGATNKEIAEQLFITRRTVESHLTSIYRKIPGGRAELRDALGILGPPDAAPTPPGPPERQDRERPAGRKRT
ncbi:LuxR family transcriptional regulator [Streptomyces ipomoeae]|uniref:LuxR family transcriptional regulator n=1 Tax=Streptomyces ipomoeae TaxID=103232 RepID=UPI0015F08846|nr:LuxR family transcriptional regulator [Streptomyces ipomoeae]MDX2939101.1 LuxR C-terminal-related transcriptional regulator [Streptomyces ipomoeae]